jgi:tetratricopeptide (TPR) repeat protein
MKKAPKWFYAVLILIPVIMIVGTELLLRSLDYGKNLTQWYEITEDKLILNPDIGARYFSNVKNYPHSNHDSFDKVKKQNSFRVFIFGGSSTAGFPYQPNGSFSRYLNDALNYSYPNKNIEVVNLAITAINSYTILDLLPGVIEQNPDLVIIYAGHNEYYGALGVGSTESIGSSQTIVKLYLFLNQFKLTQLVKSILSSTINLFADKSEDIKGGTLMARMASEKAIRLDSKIFNKGVEQFRDNLEDILSLLNERKIPTLIGTIVSNLRDQKPFISFVEDSISADRVFQEGLNNLEIGKLTRADSLLSLARDLDGLRFRAPSVFNEIIKELSINYSAVLIDIEDQFSKISPYNIVGNNLMVDHLHPTLEGQQIIGKILVKNVLDGNYISKEGKYSDIEEIDSLVKSRFAFSDLDSIAAEFRILNLLNDYPFVLSKNHEILNKFNLRNKIDTLGFKMVKENLNWEKAHQEAYKYYLAQNEVSKFIEELNVLISQYPYKLTYYNFAAQELITRKRFEDAEFFLSKRYRIKPDDFSTKWLGNINLSKNKIPEALKYLSESISLNPKDAQVYYNFAIANIKLRNFDAAVTSIKNCLKLKPDYPNAQQLLTQLTK